MAYHLNKLFQAAEQVIDAALESGVSKPYVHLYRGRQRSTRRSWWEYIRPASPSGKRVGGLLAEDLSRVEARRFLRHLRRHAEAHGVEVMVFYYFID